jgi:two-component system, chemotaxis family, chemotaxis protein CheY
MIFLLKVGTDSQGLIMLQEQKQVNLEIVVVDDSDFSRQSMLEILENSGHKVIAQAGSAEKALEIAKHSNANLFIIDVVMPNLSGIEVCKKILEKSPGTAIILISSLRGESIVIDSITAGAIDFLEKPFKKEDLLKSCLRVKNLLSRR